MNSEKSRERQSFSVNLNIIKFLLVYSFREMFFICQNLTHFHMTYSFIELLTFFLIKSSKYLLFGVYFSLYQRIGAIALIL